MVVDDVVPQSAPGAAVVGPGPVAAPPSVAVGSGGVSSYSAAALSTLKRRLGGGNRLGVGGKRHKANNANASSSAANAAAVAASVAADDVAEKHKSNKASHVEEDEDDDVDDSPIPSPIGDGSGGGAAGNNPDAGGNEGYNSEDEYSHLGLNLTEEEWAEKDRRFERQMRKKGFVIKYMGEDGSCLFRAVADQVYGDQEMHDAARRLAMDYIHQNADYFAQYITEDIETYVRRKRFPGVHGNHLEVQALSELYSRPIHIYCYSAEPINIFQTLNQQHSKSELINAPIRLCYHRGTHYNSLVDPNKATIGVGLGLPGFVPGLADRNQMHAAVNASEQQAVEKAMLEDKLKATDWEATNEAIEEQVARESYLQWLRDNERRNTGRGGSTGLKGGSGGRTSSSTAATVTSGELASAAAPAASTSANAAASPKRPPSSAAAAAAMSIAAAGAASNSPKAGCSFDRDSPKPCCSQQRSPKSASTSSSFSSSSTSSNTGLTAEFGHGVNGGGFSETASFLTGLNPNMFGLELEDWSDTGVLAQVLAASQQEYLDSLKKKSNNESAQE